MNNCRCAFECDTCRWDRLNYTGCKCPGCAPQREVRYASNQSPVEYARAIGIIYRQERVRTCDARMNVQGELKYQNK